LISVREALAIATIVLVTVGFGVFWLQDLDAMHPDRDHYVDSSTCKSCHPRQHRAWAKTFHSTMTQEARLPNIAAPLHDGQRVNAGSQSVQFHLNQEQISVTLPFLDGETRTLPVRYTIGSHRMQQFAVEHEKQIYRIPVFYSIQDREWMPISDAFFHFRDESPEGFLKGYSLWNGNCIFCHNTRPNPGMDYPNWDFESEVSELGIACEECHGNGEVHEAANHNPLRRYLTHWGEDEGSTMVHPEHIDRQRATEVCGQCHGQRVPHPRDRIVQLMTEGDPFRPGDRLADYYQAIDAETELDQTIPLRFWPDGSPRLTAYEYQGLTASKCYLESELTCVSCHSGHRGSPEGMISEEMRGDAACDGCHAGIETQAHAGHAPEDAPCRSCHMPEVVYGVMSAHPTHLIRNPDPGRTVRSGMPNACNLCHLEQSVNWASKHIEERFGTPGTRGGPAFDTPELLRGFAQGDAVYRVLLLDAMRRQGLRHELIESEAAMDGFGVVRRFGKRLDGAQHIELDAHAQDWFRQLRAAAPPSQPFEFGE
jgi:predicted CXXCH cytochrome family protein